jgi:hypothetical protein
MGFNKKITLTVKDARASSGPGGRGNSSIKDIKGTLQQLLEIERRS